MSAYISTAWAVETVPQADFVRGLCQRVSQW